MRQPRPATTHSISTFPFFHSLLKPENSKGLGILAVPPQVHPSVPTAPDQLARSPLTARSHLVHQEIKLERLTLVQSPPRTHGTGDPVSLRSQNPRTPYHCRLARSGLSGGDAEPVAIALRDYQEPKDQALAGKVNLDSIAVDIVHLVVQRQRWRSGRTEPDVSLVYVNQQIQVIFRPVETGYGGKLFPVPRTAPHFVGIAARCPG